ncbi:beta-phosphoglucomutase [Zhouia amylolytica]|uniref:Beta-phosphoglucomutase n=1 Tax=Zhouia amylolytica TaxID=376730 RepID=A0A1I6P425_9FLAO|nr:beta-phosphoglucomutase [Zhouia amylolytica]MCQ0111743.1 beta-phosphoglucomutase [Zhouia amylolytica]SFS34953.1 beta-phosphoglucomutase [Zhouia amylolytica]
MKNKGYIFDLDGVIVDTARFHFLAWKRTADELAFELTPELNEKLKGVSRVDSLNKILNWAGKSIPQDEFERLAKEKNEYYLSFVEQMTSADILPGIVEYIELLKANDFPVALGSASKNAPEILKKVGLFKEFDVIVDGNSVTKAKPDPEVFLVAAEELGVKKTNCVVFEDSEAGIEAANSAGMISVGLGDPEVLKDAKYVFADFTKIQDNLF